MNKDSLKTKGNIFIKHPFIEFFHGNRTKITIKDKVIPPCYEFEITRDSMTIHEHAKNNHMSYLFRMEEYSINDVSHGIEHFEKFGIKIQFILNELKNNRALMYESVKSENYK